MRKTAAPLSGGITDIFTRRKLDAAILEELEELLIMADIGAATAAELVEGFSQERFGKDISPEDVRSELASRIAAILEPVAVPFALQADKRPHIVLVVGVNGNGKTTTIGKLAQQLSGQGKKVMLAAADTFRAAAVEQLNVGGQRTGCEVIVGNENADPASVAYRAVEEAKAQEADILLIDTAGRLQNKRNLMEQLQKTAQVISKLEPDAPHSVLQVLDATTGQNAVSQVQAFKGMVQVSGLVITKLDGTARAGIVVALAKQFGLPIHAIGVGEGAEDLQAFKAQDFADNLLT